MATIRASHTLLACLVASIVTSGIVPHEAFAQSSKATAYDRKQDDANRRQLSSLSTSVASVKAATSTIVRGLGGTISPTGTVVLPGTLSGSKGDKGDKGERGDTGPRGAQGPVGPSGEMPSTRYFVPESSCETIDLEDLCGEDAGPGCEIQMTFYSTTTTRVIGHQTNVVMQSRTLQGSGASRYITFFASTGSSYGEGYLGKQGSTSYFFSPHGVASFQNHKAYCPSSYVAPERFTSTTYDAYKGTSKVTLRTTAGWSVSLKIVKR